MILKRYDVYIFGDMYYSKIVSRIYIYISTEKGFGFAQGGNI